MSGDEEERERYRELLEELRTVIPGVTVLFAFLLTVPFSTGFPDLDELGRDLYGAVLLGVVVAMVVLQTPAAYHRMSTDNDRSRRLRVSIRCAIVGMSLLGAAVTISVFVVARYVFDDTVFALVLSGAVGLVTLGLWYVLPLSERTRAARGGATER